jgi:hypothetical protein
MMFVLLPLKLLSLKHTLAAKLFKKLFAAMIFSEFLEINLDGYLEIIIASKLSSQDRTADTSGDIASNVLSVYTFIISVFMPYVCLWAAL